MCPLYFPFAELCPNSIRSNLLKSQNLLKTRFSTGFPTRFGQVADMSQTSQRPNKSLRHVADLTDLSQHIEIDLAGLRHVPKAGFEQEAVDYRKRQARTFAAADQ